MLTAYTLILASEPNIGTWIFILIPNPIERLNGEIERRTNVVGILPSDETIVRLLGALLLEQNDSRPFNAPDT